MKIAACIAIAAALLGTGPVCGASAASTGCTSLGIDTAEGPENRRFFIRNDCGYPVDVQVFLDERNGRYSVGSMYWADGDTDYSADRPLRFTRPRIDLYLSAAYSGDTHWLACRSDGERRCNATIECSRRMWAHCRSSGGCTPDEYLRSCGLDLRHAAKR